MSFSYYLGFELTILVCIVLIGILFVIGLIIALTDKEETLKSRIIMPFGFALLGLFCSFVVFVLLFPIFNIFFQFNAFIINFVEEINNNTIFLRFTSLLISVEIFRIIFSFSKYNRSREKYIEEFKELKTLSFYTKLDDIPFLFLGQYSIYLLAITLLWLSLIHSVTSPITVLLNWAVFFIIDDWIIIKDYYLSLRGRILKKFKIKILLFDCVIIILSYIFIFYNLKFYWTLYFAVLFALSLIVVVFSFSENINNGEEEN